MNEQKRQTPPLRSRPLTWREYVLIAVVAVLLGLSIYFSFSGPPQTLTLGCLLQCGSADSQSQRSAKVEAFELLEVLPDRGGRMKVKD